MLNMIGGVGAGSVTAGLLSQAPETWNPALYQLAVNVHDVAVKPLTSVVFTVVLYVRFIELYALTAFQSLPFAFLVHEDTKPIGVGFFKSHARTSANAVCLPFALWGWWRPKGLKPERYLGYMLRQRFGPRVYLLESYVPARFPGKPSLKEKSHSRVRGKERASPCLMSKNDKTIKSSGLRHGKMTGTSRSKNRRIPRSSKELIGYDSMLSNGIAYLGGDRWSVSLRISDINYQVATQDQQLDVVDRWGRFLNSVGENMGVQITVATRMLDPEEVTRSIAMPLQGDALDGLRGDFNRNVRRRLAGRSPRPGESAGTPDAQRRRPAHAGRMPCSPAASTRVASEQSSSKAKALSARTAATVERSAIHIRYAHAAIGCASYPSGASAVTDSSNAVARPQRRMSG